MERKKQYFLDEDSNTCHPLDFHIENAKQEKLNEIELIEAIPDLDNPEFIWCSEMTTVIEHTECNNHCPYYKAVEQNICDLRGELHDFGETITFNVDTSQPVL